MIASLGQDFWRMSDFLDQRDAMCENEGEAIYGLVQKGHPVGKLTHMKIGRRHWVFQSDRSNRLLRKLHTAHKGDPRDSSECPGFI